jgi:hypothetical protein
VILTPRAAEVLADMHQRMALVRAVAEAVPVDPADPDAFRRRVADLLALPDAQFFADHRWVLGQVSRRAAG